MTRPAMLAAVAATAMLLAGCGANGMHDEFEEAGMAVADATGAGSTETRDLEVPGGFESRNIPVRAYESAEIDAELPWATLVWAHGGSFVRGTLDWPEADWVSQRFAEAGLRVYSVDYVLASETVKAPAPSDEVEAVLAWAAEQHEGPLVAGGASAGAHLAALATLGRTAKATVEAAQVDPEQTIDIRVPDALILQYPSLHRVQRGNPEISALTAPLPDQRRFGPERLAEMYDFYLSEGGGAVVAGELPPETLALLPPTVIVNADADDLRASGEQFAEQLREAEVPVTEFVVPGTVHGYLNRPEESEQARADVQRTIDLFVAQLRETLLTP